MFHFGILRRRGGEQAFVMPLVIPAALLLLLGASTLLSRTIRNYMASSRQSEAQLARDAAESGMNRVLSALNPLAKHSTDPYLSFLLASRWEPGTGVSYTTGVSTETVRSGWRLTTLSRSSVRELLNRCGLSDRGQHPNQLPPINDEGYKNVLSGAIGPRNATTNIQLRYLVTHYVPPNRVASSLPWPSECEDFTSLTGGSGQISVEGRVIRNGRVLSTYTLTRSIDIEGWPLPQLPASWLDNSAVPALPGPPVSFRIAGQATSLRQLSMRYFRNILTDADNQHQVLGFAQQKVSLPQCRNNCPNGQPFLDPSVSSVPLETRVFPVSDVIPSNDSDLPRYPFNTNQPPAGIIPAQINESRSNYPYTPSGGLYPECRSSDLPDSNRPGEFRPNEIDCWIESIGVPVAANNLTLDPSSTISLNVLSRFDIQIGERYRVSNVQGWPGGSFTGRISSATGSTISFIPDSPPLGTPSCVGTCTISPLGDITLNVNTGRASRPVNLIVRGNVGSVGNINSSSASDVYVSIKHKVRDPEIFYSHSLGSGTRPLWNRLRIFGNMANSASCANLPPSQLQTFYIKPDPSPTTGSSLGGAFLWLPRGTLVYGSPSATISTPGSYPQDLLSVWWICNLNIEGLAYGFSPTINGAPNTAEVMNFLNPLFGNQDAVSPLLPGGFTSVTGAFTPDKRFPVYPTLMRIRSAF